MATMSETLPEGDSSPLDSHYTDSQDEEPRSRSPSFERSDALPSSPPVLPASSANDNNDDEKKSTDGEELGSEEEAELQNGFEARDWREYARDAIELGVSISQIAAGDLSMHLYNAHAAKASHYDLNEADKTAWWHRKRNWLLSKRERDRVWIPQQRWTAWPLSIDDLSRVIESRSHGEEDTITYKRAECRPSLDLEDEILALMLRRAKDQIHQHKRPVVYKSTRDLSTYYQKSRESKEVADQKPAMDEEKHEPSPAPADDILTDDDLARQILSPSVRHVLAQFDELLMALHKSRAGHIATSRPNKDEESVPPSRPRKRQKFEPLSPLSLQSDVAQDQNDDVEMRAVHTYDSEDGADAQSESDVDYQQDPAFEGASDDAQEDQAGDGAETSIEDSVENITETESTSEQHERASSQGTDEHQQHIPEQTRLRTRDWSEVLGLAALIGWDKGVIDRAAARCCSLFDESMTFSVLHDTTRDELVEMSQTSSRSQVSEHADKLVPGGTANHDMKLDLRCPVRGCKRGSIPFPKKKNLYAHLRRQHEWTYDDVERFKAGPSTGPLPPSMD